MNEPLDEPVGSAADEAAKLFGAVADWARGRGDGFSDLADTLGGWTDAVGARHRVPTGWEQVIDRDPHEQVLRRAGLSYEGSFEFSVAERWSIETLIGFVYSTSFLNRTVLERHVDEFESDLRRRLLACCADGVFEQDLTFAYELARHRGLTPRT